MMQWKKENITAENIDEVLRFCSMYEAHCINLIQYLVEEQKDLKNRLSLFRLAGWKIPLAKAFYMNGKIGAVVCINRHQFFLYCVSQKLDQVCKEALPNLEKQKEELWLLMTSTFQHSKVYALMGEGEVQIKLKEILFANSKIRSLHVMQYILMIFNADSFAENILPEVHLTFANEKSLENKIVTRQAANADASALLPLQIEYEKEEVCIGEKAIPPYVSRMNLQKILNDEIAYITTLDGIPIAKANTNAKGINWQQLGGVYTLPKYRRCGIGSLTVSALMKHICKLEKKKIALFVNVENTVAIAMYKKLNFIDAGKFMISYFG